MTIYLLQSLTWKRQMSDVELKNGPFKGLIFSGGLKSSMQYVGTGTSKQTP